MITIIYWMMIALVPLAIFVKAYNFWEENRSKFSNDPVYGQKLVRAVSITLGLAKEPSVTFVVFDSANRTEITELKHVADSIRRMVSDNSSIHMESLQEFVEYISKSQHSRPIKIPLLISSHPLQLARIQLQDRFKHPNWKSSGVVICRYSGLVKKSVQHVAWNLPQAQALYSGA